jgi:hypothetical protein
MHDQGYLKKSLWRRALSDASPNNPENWVPFDEGSETYVFDDGRLSGWVRPVGSEYRRRYTMWNVFSGEKRQGYNTFDQHQSAVA